MKILDLAGTSVSELRERFLERGVPLPSELEVALEADPRAGAREVLRLVRKRRHENRAEGQRLRHLLRFETELWERGVVHVAGVDEAGMAPLAGPVVAGACILPHDYRPRGVDDSKQLDAAERERLAEDIKKNAICWGIGRAEVEEIDTLNIYRAGLLALRRAVEALGRCPDHLLVDARKLPELRIPQTPIIHGDALSLTIAAASILAKTTRDALMAELDLVHPSYGFARHKGYPTAEHFEALRCHGACAIHRRSFQPVRVALGLEPVQAELFPVAIDGGERAPLSAPLTPTLSPRALSSVPIAGAGGEGDELSASGASRPVDELSASGASRPVDELSASGASRPVDELSASGASRPPR